MARRAEPYRALPRQTWLRSKHLVGTALA